MAIKKILQIHSFSTYVNLINILVKFLNFAFGHFLCAFLFAWGQNRLYKHFHRIINARKTLDKYSHFLRFIGENDTERATNCFFNSHLSLGFFIGVICSVTILINNVRGIT